MVGLAVEHRTGPLQKHLARQVKDMTAVMVHNLARLLEAVVVAVLEVLVLMEQVILVPPVLAAVMALPHQ
jgi:hypothetical protein